VTTELSAFREDYETQAIQEAIESGMARRELMETLGGLRISDFIPPHAGEPVADYAARATGELMVRYLAQDQDDTVPPV
jgi:hypothetical protein